MTTRYTTIRFPDYLNHVKFKDKSPIEKCKHLLFFVTVVALQPGEKAYELTETAKKEMIRDINLHWATFRWYNDWDVLAISWLIGTIILAIFVIGVWECATSGLSCLDFNVFKERLNMTKMPDEEKATYFLYYITDHMRLIRDMTPQVISERMAETGIGTLSPDAINSYFLSHPSDVIPSTIRSGAYRLSDNKSKEIKTLLAVKPPKEVTLMWVLENFPLTVIAWVIGVLCSLAAGGYFVGKIAGRYSRLATQETL